MRSVLFWEVSQRTVVNLSSRVKKEVQEEFLTLEDVIDKLTRNVVKEFPLQAA